MFELDTRKLLEIYADLSKVDVNLERIRKEAQTYLNSAQISGLTHYLKPIHGTCLDLHLIMCMFQTSRIEEVLQQNGVKYTQIAELFAELRRRIYDELRSKVHYVLDEYEAEYVRNASPFGDAVFDAFPSAAEDILESSKCLGLSRYTASVFHLMRALEVG